MYQAQIQNVDGIWVPLCEPTPSFRQAQRVADEFADDPGTRVACVDADAGVK